MLQTSVGLTVELYHINAWGKFSSSICIISPQFINLWVRIHTYLSLLLFLISSVEYEYFINQATIVICILQPFKMYIVW